MANIYTSAEQLVGKTPLLELTHIEKELKLQAKIFAIIIPPTHIFHLDANVF